ncbi:MAG: hypothetical protein ACLRQA_09105, partial [Anaerovoracaceae bacterium]
MEAKMGYVRRSDNAYKGSTMSVRKIHGVILQRFRGFLHSAPCPFLFSAPARPLRFPLFFLSVRC